MFSEMEVAILYPEFINQLLARNQLSEK